METQHENTEHSDRAARQHHGPNPLRVRVVTNVVGGVRGMVLMALANNYP